jgi:hypothetical protein
VSGEVSPVAKLKHLSAQVAIDPQVSIDLSHGSAAPGQQSCSASDVDISAASCGLSWNAAPPIAGSMATDTEMSAANMIRPTRMVSLITPE